MLYGKSMDAGQRPNLELQVDCTTMPDHLFVTAAGAWTQETFRRIVDSARTSAINQGLTRILLDTRSVSRPDSEYTRYLSGLYLAHALPRPFRVAAVGAPGNVTHYGETVARNRGSDFMAFSDQDRAMQWLLRL
jgi:hypothetical protein